MKVKIVSPFSNALVLFSSSLPVAVLAAVQPASMRRKLGSAKTAHPASKNQRLTAQSAAIASATTLRTARRSKEYTTRVLLHD